MGRPLFFAIPLGPLLFKGRLGRIQYPSPIHATPPIPPFNPGPFSQRPKEKPSSAPFCHIHAFWFRSRPRPLFRTPSRPSVPPPFPYFLWPENPRHTPAVFYAWRPLPGPVFYPFLLPGRRLGCASFSKNKKREAALGFPPFLPVLIRILLVGRRRRRWRLLGRLFWRRRRRRGRGGRRGFHRHNRLYYVHRGGRRR